MELIAISLSLGSIIISLMTLRSINTTNSAIHHTEDVLQEYRRAKQLIDESYFIKKQN